MRPFGQGGSCHKMNEKKRVTLLGSTGSIGTQSLEVIRHGAYSVFGLAAYSNDALLLQQIQAFSPAVVCMVEPAATERLERALQGSSGAPKLLKGPQGLAELAGMAGADIVLNAVVGIAGLASTLAAIESGKDLALANKESLVTGGQLVMAAVKRHGVHLLPVDSEHSAIFQCLQDAPSAKALDRILLTASGGPFFGRTREQLQNVTPADALHHPNWSMGAKITVDSATLMNKGLEVIEASWLFGVPCEHIDILVQRQSIIHSMVQFIDHSVLAQLGVPDMRIPIQYALTWPQRTAGCAPRLDFAALRTLTFDSVDEETFRCLPACKKALQAGGLAACAANGANEAAVALFLQEKLPFLRIGELVERVVDDFVGPQTYTLQDVYDCDKAARAYVQQHVQ